MTSSAQLLKAFSEDRLLAAQTLFEHEDETPPFHAEMTDLWRAADEQVLIEAFRGSAKTTLACEFLSLEALFGNFRFAIILADKEDKAIEKLALVKYLIGSREVRALFGDVRGTKDNEHVLHLSNGIRIQAFGREQSPRGLLYNVARPDRAFLDDVEKSEHVASSAAVDDTMRWLYGEVIPALDKNRRRVRVCGTPLARDCLITRLRHDPHWVSRSYPVVSGDLDGAGARALWPARYPLNWVRRQREMYAQQGMLTQFMQEYMCRAEEQSEKPFDANDLLEAPSPPFGWLPRYAIYDPARTAKKTSNRTGKAVISWAGSKLIVHESAGYFWKPSELISDIFAANALHRPIAIGVESDSLDEFLREPLRTEMVARNTSLPLVDLRAPKQMAKEDFIKSLQPFSIAGDIVLVGGRAGHAQLVRELQAFPSKDVDVANALAYATRMRIGQPVYEDFGADNIAESPNVLHGKPVYLAFNATLKECTCAAFQIDGQHIVCHADWIIPGDLNDAAQTIRLAANAEFARSRLVSFAPSGLFDDWARIPLIRSLRARGINPARASSTSDSRGALASYIRTTARGSRCLRVASHLSSLLNALSAGYAVPISNTGRLADTAVDNHYKTLAEGLESAVHALSRNLDSQGAVHYATSPEGARYITSRPGVSFRK